VSGYVKVNLPLIISHNLEIVDPLVEDPNEVRAALKKSFKECHN
jgi:hypothetical protein